MTRVRLEQLLWLSIVIRVARCRCAYDVDENLMPYKVDKEAFPIGDITTQCIEYIGEGGMGCCNKFND